MRLIDADALKEELLSWARVISDPRLMATDDAMCVIDHAPTVAASPWHRVEEELPPKGFALIGARKRPPEISEDVCDMWVCEYDGEWGWQDMDGYALRGITHWMPIEPPKEDE